MTSRALTLALAAALTLASAGCGGERVDLPVEAARAGERPAAPEGELGREGDRLLAASPAASWVAICRGERGVLVLDASSSIAFRTLEDHDASGRWVIVEDDASPAPNLRLVDTWARTTTLVPGGAANLSRDGRRLAYTTKEGVVVRELASGEERRFVGDGSGGVGRLDPSGRFLYLTKVHVQEDSRPPEASPGSCEDYRGAEEGRMARIEHTIVAIDEPGEPYYAVPRGSTPVRATLGGWPLVNVYAPPQVQRWRPGGVEVVLDGVARIDADDVHGGGLVYTVTRGEEGVLHRYAGGRVSALAPRAWEDNRPAPDSYLVGGEAGVLRVSEGRFVHLASGAIVSGDPSAPHAYADGERVLLLGEGAAILVDARRDEVLHRYAAAASPSLALGPWVALRGRGEAIVLDLGRAGWVGRVAGTAVALAADGHGLVATGAPTEGAPRGSGPFVWKMPEGT